MQAMASRATMLAFALGLVTACTSDEPEPPGLGYADAASEDLLKKGAPIIEHDLEATAARGHQLATMERILGLAYRRGLPRVGNANAAILVPMALVDDGMRSGEVVFYRWFEKDLERDGTFNPDKSRRWLVVPMLLQPDRVLELEQFDDSVEIGDEAHRRLSAMKQALEYAQEEYPGGDWRVHSMREQMKEGVVRINVTRVFLMAVAPDAHPDLEIVVEDGRRKRPGKIIGVSEHHAPGAVGKRPLVTLQNRPGVPTVARALDGATVADRIDVRAADGSMWRIDGERGTIERMGAGDEEDEGDEGDEKAETSSAQ